jgi:hypothetical protein
MIKKLNYKLKIIIVSVALLAFIFGMFLYGYAIMGDKNQGIADTMAQKSLEWEVLKREQQSVQQGKIDLAILDKAAFPPEQLFIDDTKLVKEIQILETTAEQYNLKLNISISGTSKTAAKVKGTKAELFNIPYSMTLKGDFANTMQYIQALEHLPFVTHVKRIQVGTDPEEGAITLINADFFIRK